MYIERALKIPGWTTVGELIWLAELACKSTNIVEIGSWRGRSCLSMADNSDATIFAVDTWDDKAIGYSGWWTELEDKDKYVQPDWLFKEYQSNLAPYINKKVHPKRMDSQSAAESFLANGITFDMIFIDADHSLDGVIKDIYSWSPLLRPNGVLCGHDYDHPLCPDVSIAVSKLLPNVKIFETIWRAECDIASLPRQY